VQRAAVAALPAERPRREAQVPGEVRPPREVQAPGEARAPRALQGRRAPRALQGRRAPRALLPVFLPVSAVARLRLSPAQQKR